jgi:ferredoxin--NADP+ reductase
MNEGTQAKHSVAIIGSGPAGLYAAQELAHHGVEVALFNRDIKPGGLAEYGIYPNKLKMKSGLRNQFRQILHQPGIHYYGNVVVGEHADLSLDELNSMGFQALFVSIGAQGTKRVGIPGENLIGVYHAKEVVYHYNRLPPYSLHTYPVGKHVAVVGIGNVMVDITHYLVCDRWVEDVIVFARRGPGEIKFDKKELENIVAYLDMEKFEAEMERVTPLMLTLGQDPQAPRDLIQSALPKGIICGSSSNVSIQFLASTTKVVGDEFGRVVALEVEDNTLVMDGEQTRVRTLGTRHQIAVDTVIFAIGDQVEEEFGLPVKNGEYVKNPEPRFPIDGHSYEICDPAAGQVIKNVFVAGWARNASYGLVGVARKDGVNGARALLQYLESLSNSGCEWQAALQKKLNGLGKPIVGLVQLEALEAVEQARAQAEGLPEFKFASNVEMLTAMGL